MLQKPNMWDFPGGPVAKSLPPNERVPGLISDQGTRYHMPQLKKKKKKKIHVPQYRPSAGKQTNIFFLILIY